ncbi:MAG: hypothetical protein SFU56_17115 [Capsulimonadales bacterium]|nr:hypothetical protein [Capsulimonadales bacterium]
MKQVVSLSLGSSKRNKTVTLELLGQTFVIRREGVDGDQRRFMARLAELDGTVDAIGFGGMDRYLWSEGRRYEFTAARRLLAPAKRTPVVDGSGLKNTLEREAVRWLVERGIVDFARHRTLIVAGVDRFGMSEAVAAQGGEVLFGDLMFALGIPFPIRGIGPLRRLARLLLPVIVRMPLALLYPMGESQDRITPKYGDRYGWADIIAGDFHYIRRYLPPPESGLLAGKTILTNTTTPEDEAELARRGVRLLVTTTPNFDGRSFGTNVLEAVCVAANDGRELTSDGYLRMVRDLRMEPSVRPLPPLSLSTRSQATPIIST